MSDNALKNYGLDAKDKRIVDLLEEILEVLKDIRRASGTRPSPS